MLEFVAYPLKQIIRAFAGWSALGKAIYWISSCLYRRRKVSWIVFLALYFFILRLTDIIFRKVAPTSPTDGWQYLLGMPLSAIMLTTLMIAVPVLLVAYIERRKRASTAHLSRVLDEPSLYTHPQETFVAGDERLCHLLVNVARSPGRELHIITPTGFYFVADEVRRDLEASFLDDEPYLSSIVCIAKHAREFRNALEEFPGILHFVLPDISDPNVLASIRRRAQVVDLAPDLEEKGNRAALRAVQQICRRRMSAGRKAYLHLASFCPGRRLLIADEVCFTQQYPPDRVSLLEPTHVLVNEGNRPEFKYIRHFARALVEGL